MIRSSRAAGPFVCMLVAAGVGAAPAAAEAQSWPGLRGPSFDGAVHGVRLFDGGSARLSLAWKRALGSGYSTLAVADGTLVAMFSDGDADVAAAFDAGTGAERWRYRIGDRYVGHDGSHDGPISSPLLAAGRVYGLGPRGHLFALDAATGATVWAKNLVDEHAAVKPHYGFATSPVLADGVLVVEMGAKEGKSIAGFAAEDGRLLWSLGDDEIHYHSPIVATLGGRRQVLAVGSKTLYGLEAATGEVLWSHEHQGDDRAMGGETIVPVPAGDSRVLLLNKIDSSSMLEIVPGGEADSGGWQIRELWSNNSIRSTYVIPVYHEGHLYGMTGRIFTCVDAATGETRWRSREPGDGFPTLVGEHLVVITKPGQLFVVEASPEAYREVTRLELFDDHSWSAVAYAGGRLYARSMSELARVDVSGEPVAAAPVSSWVERTAFGAFLAEAERAADKRAVIERYLASQSSFPIVDDTGAVHFVYRGEATDVGIVGDMIGYRREDPMSRLDGTDLFHYSTRLEPDAAVTYGFIPDYGEPVADPLNPATAEGLFGEVSWLAMPAWSAPAWLGQGEPARAGRLEEIEWSSTVREGQTRKAEVWLPPGYDAAAERSYPVLYVFGGDEALEQGRMKEALDHLAGTAVEPLLAVFVLPEGEARRDMGDVESYGKMIATELVPLIDGRYRTRAEPMGRGVAGAAGGANAAWHAALRYPDLFGRLGSQASTMERGEIEPELGGAEERTLVVYMDWGTYHLRSPHEAWDLAEENRATWALLRERGHRPAGGELPEGFGWACWRAHTDEMLAALFPPSR